MRIFVTGGAGLTGPPSSPSSSRPAIRSPDWPALMRLPAESRASGPLRSGDRSRTSIGCVRGAQAADGVLHMAFGGGNYSDPEFLITRDTSALTALGEVLIGSGKPLVSTSGTLVMPTGRVSTEQDAADPHSIAHFRIPGEQACLSFGERGVRASVVRLEPTVHGPATEDSSRGSSPPHAEQASQPTSATARTAGRRSTASTPRLFRLALEKAPAGSALHGAGESGVTLQSIAATIAEMLELPTKSVSADAAPAHFESPFLAAAYGADAPVSSAATQQLLGWAPTHPTLLQDLRSGDYFNQ